MQTRPIRPTHLELLAPTLDAEKPAGPLDALVRDRAALPAGARRDRLDGIVAARAARRARGPRVCCLEHTTTLDPEVRLAAAAGIDVLPALLDVIAEERRASAWRN